MWSYPSARCFAELGSQVLTSPCPFYSFNRQTAFHNGCRKLSSKFVTYLSKELSPLFNVRIGFYTLALQPINNANYPPTLRCLGDDDFQRVRGSRENRANLWHFFDFVQNV